MPEGPEVSFLTSYINEKFQGKFVIKIDILSGRYRNHGPPSNYTKFVSSMPLKLEKVVKKGKVMFFYFSKGWYMMVRLGMTGWWYVKGDEPTWKYMRPNILFHFRDKSIQPQEPLIFSDFRNFGTLTITKDASIVSKEMEGLARDIMSRGWSARNMICEVSKHPKRQHQSIEDAIMNQHFFMSGIGNYLKSEVLYDARIAPSRTLESLSHEEWRRLFHSAKKVTRRMFNVLMQGNDDQYIANMKVYRKSNDPYGNKVVSYIASNGRTTFWVPRLQK